MSMQDKPEVPFRIPDIPHVGLTTDDAQDPDTHSPPTGPRRPRIRRRHQGQKISAYRNYKSSQPSGRL